MPRRADVSCGPAWPLQLSCLLAGFCLSLSVCLESSVFTHNPVFPCMKDQRAGLGVLSGVTWKPPPRLRTQHHVRAQESTRLAPTAPESPHGQQSHVTRRGKGARLRGTRRNCLPAGRGAPPAFTGRPWAISAPECTKPAGWVLVGRDPPCLGELQMNLKGSEGTGRTQGHIPHTSPRSTEPAHSATSWPRVLLPQGFREPGETQNTEPRPWSPHSGSGAEWRVCAL